MAIYFDRPAPAKTQWLTIGNQDINFDDVRRYEVVGDDSESSVRLQYKNGDMMIIYTGTPAECEKFRVKLSDQLKGN